MARSDVRLVLTADDGKALQAAAKLLEKIRETGHEQENTTRKGKDGWDKVGQSILSMVGPLGTVSGAAKGLLMVFEEIKQSMEAIRQEQERSAAVSKSYGEAFGKVASSMGGASSGELAAVDRQLRDMASRRALGEGGLVKLTDTYAQISGAMISAPQSAKMGALEEAAKYLELSPTDGATGIGLGVAKIMESTGLSPTQSMNLMQQQRRLSLVDALMPIGQSIPPLAGAARAGNTSLQDMMAFQAFISQTIGDVTGQESTTAVSGMVSQMMTRGSELEKKLGGMASFETTDNFFQRFDKIRDLNQRGLISEEMLGEMLPTLTRGGEGKAVASYLLGEGMNVFNRDYRTAMNDPALLRGDLTAESLANVKEALPAEVFQGERRLLASQVEAGRAGDAGSAKAIMERERFMMALELEARPESYRNRAGFGFDVATEGLGFGPEAGERLGRGAGRGLSMKNLVGAGLLTAAVPGLGTMAGLEGDKVVDLLTKIYNSLSGRKDRIPRRALPTGADR